MLRNKFFEDEDLRGIGILPFTMLKAVMRQPSTRTGGSMTTAMAKLGGSHELISGMAGSSEAKGETLWDSWVAFATQADIIGTRTPEIDGPAFAAEAIHQTYLSGDLRKNVPVINLGDGWNEHPTQALGDLFTIHKSLARTRQVRPGQLRGLKMAVIGDHERYRAHHSLILGGSVMGLEIFAVESEAAPVPPEIEEEVMKIGGQLYYIRDVADLLGIMKETDVLYMGRNPDEYSGNDTEEKARSQALAKAYKSWRIDLDRLNKYMNPDGIVMHPRPRRDELHPSVDAYSGMRDIEQMANMIPMRAAIIAQALGKSIRAAA